MRLTFILLAAAFALVSRSDAVSADVGAQEVSKMIASTVVDSVDAVPTRFLRTGKTVDDDDSDENDSGDKYSDDEERAPLIDAFVGKIPSTAKRLTVTDGKKLSKTLDYAIKHWQIKSKNTKLLRQIEDEGWTPKTMGVKLDIVKKVESMTAKQLKYDMDYLLWRQYLTYWGKRHPVKLSSVKSI